MGETNVSSLFSQMHFIEQFVEKVVSYTSKYNTSRSISYAPDTIIGKPNNYPDYGDFAGTYILRSYGKWWKKSESFQQDYMPQDVQSIETEDYIIVKFEQAVIATKVVIYETYNPGAVVRLWGGSGNGNWKLLWQGPPQEYPHTSNLFTPSIRIIKEPIYLLRIDFNQSHLNYHTAIDGVLLAGYKSKTHIQTKLFVTAFVSDKEKPKPKTIVNENINSQSTFNILPYEILVYIFGYLDLKSLSNCAQVNKTFHHASTDTALYRQVCFKRYWHQINDKVLETFIPKCKFLCQLDLSWCGNDNSISEIMFIRFLKNCEQTLTHLSLGNCSFINDTSMVQISNCTKLTELRLRNLRLKASYEFVPLSKLNHLITLDLFSTNIDDETLIQILTNNPDLEHLNIDLCENLQVLDLIMIVLSKKNLKLRTISSWKNRSLTSEGVENLSKCYNLREIDLGWIFFEPNDCLSHIAQNCPHLTRLIITVWRSLSENQILAVIRNCPKLRQLDLMGIRCVNVNICYCALKNLPDLELLDISFCNGIPNSKVIAWRKEFPKVTFVRSCEYDNSYNTDFIVIHP